MGLNLASMFVSTHVNNAGLRSGLKRSEALVAKSMGKMRAMAGQIFAQAGIVGFGYALYQGAKAAATFEDSMVQVRINAKLLGDQGAASFKQLRDEARRLGATTRFSAGEAAEAMNNLALAGLSVKQIMEVSEPTLNLATAANIKLADSTKIAMTQMKIWAMEASQVPRIADTLVAAQANMRTTVSELNEGMAIAGAIAKKVGMDFEEFTATIGLMQERSDSASKAGVALSIAIQKIAAPSKETAAILEEAGINLEKFRRESTGEIDTFDAMSELATKGATGVKAVTKLFGARGKEIIKLFDVVSASGKRGIEAVKEMADTLKKSTGFAAKAAEARMKTFIGRLLELKAALEDVAITLIGPLLDGFLAVMRPMTQMIRQITPLNEAFNGLGADILKTAVALGLVAYLLPVVGNAARALGAVIRYQMISTGWGALFVVLGTVMVSLLQIYKNMKKHPDAKWVKDLMGIWRNLNQAWKNGIVIFREWAKEFLAIWGFNLNEIEKGWGKFFENQRDEFIAFLTFTSRTLLAMTKEWEKAYDLIAAFVAKKAVDMAVDLETHAQDNDTDAKGRWAAIDAWVETGLENTRNFLRNAGKMAHATGEASEEFFNIWSLFRGKGAHERMGEGARRSLEETGGLAPMKSMWAAAQAAYKGEREGFEKDKVGGQTIKDLMASKVAEAAQAFILDPDVWRTLLMDVPKPADMTGIPSAIGDTFKTMFGRQFEGVFSDIGASASDLFTGNMPGFGGIESGWRREDELTGKVGPKGLGWGALIDGFFERAHHWGEMMRSDTYGFAQNLAEIPENESLLGRGSTSFGGMGKAIQDAIFSQEADNEQKKLDLMKKNADMSEAMVKQAEMIKEGIDDLPKRITKNGLLGK